MDSVSNSVENQFHHKDTKAQSTQRIWHISIKFLGALISRRAIASKSINDEFIFKPTNCRDEPRLAHEIWQKITFLLRPSLAYFRIVLGVLGAPVLKILDAIVLAFLGVLNAVVSVSTEKDTFPELGAA